MALYFLSYDLRKKRDYQRLYDELKKFNAVKILESTWCLNHSNTSATEITKHFMQFIDDDDGLVVSEVKDWASIGTLKTPKDLP